MILNYDTDEGKVLSAINRALGGEWWDELRNDTQEAIHDELYGVMETSRQDKGSAEQRQSTSKAAPCSLCVTWAGAKRYKFCPDCGRKIER
jgi:hypothetical protein